MRILLDSHVATPPARTAAPKVDDSGPTSQLDAGEQSWARLAQMGTMTHREHEEVTSAGPSSFNRPRPPSRPQSPAIAQPAPLATLAPSPTGPLPAPGGRPPPPSRTSSPAIPGALASRRKAPPREPPPQEPAELQHISYLSADPPHTRYLHEEEMAALQRAGAEGSLAWWYGVGGSLQKMWRGEGLERRRPPRPNFDGRVHRMRPNVPVLPASQGVDMVVAGTGETGGGAGRAPLEVPVQPRKKPRSG
ncbi:hypothetical protein HDV00_000385 [Rhizophlyctis rosea]|nr:hypothetical protein HDV00_000385 [Rhizophlyctis rosea]